MTFPPVYRIIDETLRRYNLASSIADQIHRPANYRFVSENAFRRAAMFAESRHTFSAAALPRQILDLNLIRLQQFSRRMIDARDCKLISDLGLDQALLGSRKFRLSFEDEEDRARP